MTLNTEEMQVLHALELGLKLAEDALVAIEDLYPQRSWVEQRVYALKDVEQIKKAIATVESWSVGS